jgi:hypothetical protein
MYKITEEQKKVIEKGLLTAIDNGTDDEFTSQEMHLINDAFELVNNLTIPDVSHQRELLELVTEIASSNQVYSNTRHKLWAKKLISSNCG